MLGIVNNAWRELWVDASLPLRDLHHAIVAAFDRRTDDYRADGRYLFASRAPHLPLGATETTGHDRDPTENPWYSGWHYERPGWAHRPAPKRWGDRWTMIECRDPDVIDDASVTIAETLRAQHPLFYGVNTDATWWFRVETVGLDRRHPDAAGIELDSGHGRAPLTICPDATTWNVWMLAAAQPDHESHDETRAMLDRAVGPWATFDVSDFDAVGIHANISRALTKRTSGSRGRASWRTTGEATCLEELLASVPDDAAAGLRTHLSKLGATDPPAITPDAAAAQVEPFQRLVRSHTGGAIERADGIDEAEPEVVAAAKRLGLVHSRKGLLTASKRAAEAAHDPVALRTLMAHELLRRRGHSQPLSTVLLLSIVDGSIADAKGSSAVFSAVLATCDAVDRFSPFARVGDPRRSPGRSAEEVDRLLLGIVDTLSTLGLGKTPEGTFTTTPALVAFAWDALH